MNIALYAMYIALIIPDARKSAPVAAVTAAAAALSCLITYIPFTSGIGSGWTIIIAGVTAAVAGALLFPRDVETSEDRQE